MQRREESHVCKAVQKWKVDGKGKGKGGRPKLRWKDCIKKDLSEAKADATAAIDREKWRKLIHYADPT